MTVDFAALLRPQGIKAVEAVVSDISGELWQVGFDADQERGIPNTMAYLLLPKGATYVLCLARIGTLAAPPEELPAAVLAVLVRVQSEEMLAKVDYLQSSDGNHIWSALSPCSMDGISGQKLAARLQATARLAGKAGRALSATRATSRGS